MSAFSKLIRGISKTVAGVGSIAPDPIAKGIGFGASIIASDTAKRQQKALLEKQRKDFTMQFPSGYDPVTGSLVGGGQSSQRSGFGSSFGSFLGDATQNILSPLGGFFGGLQSLFGGGRPTSTSGQPAITTVTNVGAQESSDSGAMEGNIGSLLPTLTNIGRTLFGTPGGQIAVGTGVGTALSLIGADGKPMRVTRKMKAQARSLLNMTGGNLSATAELLGINEQQLVMILLKRFRNDGPVVTKAALRKTKSTIRKLKNMCDMYDDLRPAARRRSPMKRATRSSTTLIKN